MGLIEVLTGHKGEEAQELSSKEEIPKKVEPENLKICLYIPDELIQQYQQLIFDRCNDLELDVHIEKSSAIKVTSSKYRWVLQLVPPPVSSKTPVFSTPFRFPYNVKGSVAIKRGKLPPHSENETLKRYVDHFFKLLEKIIEREQNSQFQKLLYAEANIKAKAQEVIELEEAKESIVRGFDSVEDSYYNAVSYLLNDAIDQLHNISESLEELMRSLTKIMIIDDLGERTLEGLAQLGYKEERLFSMSSWEIKEKLEAFKASENNNKIAVQDFFFALPEFEKIDVLFVNLWNEDDDSMPIIISTRKKTILSKEEEKILSANPEELQKKIESEEEARSVLKEKIKVVLETIKKMEASTDTSENKYQIAVKNRKRLIRDLKRRTLRLKDLNKIVNKEKDENKIYRWDLFETFKDHQDFMAKIGDAAAEWGFDHFWNMRLGAESTSFIALCDFAKLAKKHISLEDQISKIKKQIEFLSLQTIDVAQKNGMIPELKEEKLVRSSKQKKEDAVATVGYEGFIENHIVDKMELAILSCGIVNAYEGVRTQLKQEAKEKAEREAEEKAKLEAEEKAKLEADEKID